MDNTTKWLVRGAAVVVIGGGVVWSINQYRLYKALEAQRRDAAFTWCVNYDKTYKELELDSEEARRRDKGLPASRGFAWPASTEDLERMRVERLGECVDERLGK